METCPFHTELNNERLSWGSNNSAGAINSPLKLPLAGGRFFPDGSLFNVGTEGSYWSSTVDLTFSRFLFIDSVTALFSNGSRVRGLSVRCLKD